MYLAAYVIHSLYCVLSVGALLDWWWLPLPAPLHLSVI